MGKKLLSTTFVYIRGGIMSDLELMDFKKQIFAIKDSNEKGYIIYAPLKKVCFWVDNEYGD